ncbi:hypothetical protein [uncultured Gimesia sp.]|uniref:hypothetical protein n=1 Tax=uncultured Gimesia sp. TaxID=1678688 RepID=UPI002603E3CD|nr:hypothetical protein [uncultured Gimesia sp.]
MKKALELIKKCYVVRWSWWEIQVQEMDSQEWPEHVGYYGRRGGKLAKPPYEKCVEIYKKEGRYKQFTSQNSSVSYNDYTNDE